VHQAGCCLPIGRYVDDVLLAEPVRGEAAHASVDRSAGQVEEGLIHPLAGARIDVPGERLTAENTNQATPGNQGPHGP
jgi:hypothetical protein